MTPQLEPTERVSVVEQDASYPVPILVTSGIGIGAFALGAMLEGEDGRDTRASETLMTVAVPAMLIVPIVVHSVKGRAGQGAASLGVRLGFGALGMWYGASSCEGDCGMSRIGPGLLVGMGIASLIDAFVLAKHVERRVVRGPREGVQWTPVAAPTSGGAQVGVAAVF